MVNHLIAAKWFVLPPRMPCLRTFARDDTSAGGHASCTTFSPSTCITMKGRCFDRHAVARFRFLWLHSAVRARLRQHILRAIPAASLSACSYIPPGFTTSAHRLSQNILSACTPYTYTAYTACMVHYKQLHSGLSSILLQFASFGRTPLICIACLRHCSMQHTIHRPAHISCLREGGGQLHCHAAFL